ncbi:MAG: symmetrical bis(5'-nucleosyl)-tetraphosphatase [Porticoccaceae bacterium]|nr:symmetrical bis(5'-nucleosyl)-tetraphosphatase [Porticoccaceae bacterium]
MTDYVVGDIQGCLNPLLQLLDRVNFEPTTDRLIAVGDLVNRGPQSLETLRFCKGLGSAFTAVLGNHDLHLLAISHGIRTATSKDTLNEILSASDRDELLDWLQQLPLLLSIGDYTLVHAGIPPNWSIATAVSMAREVEAVLQSEQASLYFQHMYGNQPDSWSDDLEGPERWRLITNYLTRMRYCTSSGQLELNAKTAPNSNKTESLMAEFAPWYSHKQRLAAEDKIVFGHWAALEGKDCGSNLFPMDTGYVWGGAMRLMNLDSGEQYHQYAKSD